MSEFREFPVPIFGGALHGQTMYAPYPPPAYHAVPGANDLYTARQYGIGDQRTYWVYVLASLSLPGPHGAVVKALEDCGQVAWFDRREGVGTAAAAEAPAGGRLLVPFYGGKLHGKSLYVGYPPDAEYLDNHDNRYTLRRWRPTPGMLNDGALPDHSYYVYALHGLPLQGYDVQETIAAMLKGGQQQVAWFENSPAVEPAAPAGAVTIAANILDTLRESDALAVGYRELASGPGYSHRAVEVQMLVRPGETADDALARARDFVTSRLAGAAVPPAERAATLLDLEQQVAGDYETIKAQQAKIRALSESIRAMEERWHRAAGFLRHHGLEAPPWPVLSEDRDEDKDTDDLPFD